MMKKLIMLLGLVALVSIAMPAMAFENGACTPGYWKNHADLWECFDPEDSVCVVFDELSNCDLNGDGDTDTLMDALKYRGGSGLEGAQRNLLRIGTAAILSECALGGVSCGDPDPYDWCFQYDINDVLDTFSTRGPLLDLKDFMDGALNSAYCPCNNRGCPDFT